MDNNSKNNKSAYQLKREKALEYVIGGRIKNNSSYNYYKNQICNTRVNITDIASSLDLIKHRRPFTKEHIKYKSELENKFNSKKEYDKFITATLKLKDFDLRYDLISTNKINIFLDKSVPFVKKIEVINLLAEKQISCHNFFSNVPANILYPELWFKLIFRVLNYSMDTNTIYRILMFSNYKRVLTAKNKDELIKEVEFLETNRSLYSNDDSASVSHMLLTNIPDDNDFLSFSKNTSIITSIGKDTLCCFRKNGVGEPLMFIALKSPIAAIIWGIEDTNNKWFSYTWEMLEYNEEKNVFEIQLILDNIEAQRMLSVDSFYRIKRDLKEYNKYNKVYLGYCRNDIEIPRDVINTKKTKLYTIPFYGKEVRKYQTYDDSKYIYTVLDRKLPSDKYEKRILNLGDFHRIQYILNEQNNLKEKLFITEEDNLLKHTRINRKFDINKNLDMEKSFIECNDYAIKSFELYDKEGKLYAKFN